jgi:hypothetical protein
MGFLNSFSPKTLFLVKHTVVSIYMMGRHPISYFLAGGGMVSPIGYDGIPYGVWWYPLWGVVVSPMGCDGIPYGV